MFYVTAGYVGLMSIGDYEKFQASVGITKIWTRKGNRMPVASEAKMADGTGEVVRYQQNI